MEVTIAPSSSCYFAGEEFRVNITFTNSTAPSAAARSHRRGHSISSAPLARPPTSPGTFGHKYAPSSPAAVNSAPLNAPWRRGLVGSPTPPEHPAKTRLKRIAASKSLSTSLSQAEVSQIVLETGSSSTAVNRKISSEKPFPSNHPHARKQSVQWNAIENTPPPTAHSSPHPLSLDPINEIELSSPPMTPGFASPALGGPSSEPPAPHAAPGVPSSTVNPSLRGLGIEFPSVSRTDKRTGPKSASAGNLPIQGAETLLWAYAQVSGSVEIDQDTVDYGNLSTIRTKLARSGPIGGGRMDLHDRSPNSAQQNDGSWSSFFGLSSLSPYRNTSPSPSSFLSSMLSVRSSSARMTPPGPSGIPDALPTFNPPQSMLAVDLTLAPGESKTYSYTIRLPSALPPTYRGRTFKFSYNLVIGTCRGRAAGVDSQSRLLRIPLRVYNHVSVGRPSVRYDLLWPSTITGKSDFDARVEEVLNPSRSTAKSVARSARRSPQADLLVQFGRDLIRGQVRHDHDDVEDVIDHTTGDGCRLAVEVLTRQAKKASYDVHRAGTPVASLVMPKTTFRLGETVHGIISLNCFENGMKVVKISVLLETQERIPASLASGVKPTGLRRVQAEQHNDMVVNLQRTPFALDIPSDASPGFAVDVGGGGGGGLEWRVRICFLVGDGDARLDLVGGDGEWGVSKAAGDGESLGKLETVESNQTWIYMDRRSRFSPDPILQSLRARAASQPPRSSGAPEYSLFAFPEASNQPQQRSAQSPAREGPWGQRLGRSPAAVSRTPQGQGQLRSASFSATAHPPENDIWLPSGGRFQSTFEEDDEDSLDAWTDSFTGQPRSWANNSESRFRSQIPGTRSRSLVPTHGLSPSGLNGLSGEWSDRGLSQSIDQRFLSGYPSSRVNGSRAQSLQGTSSMPAALALRGSQPEISNLSPFVRDRLGPRLTQEDMNGGYDHWPSYMGTMREEEPGSGATSRRHSVSIVQPRARGVGFAASGASAGEEGPPSRMLGGMGRSMFSDEELAGDFSLLGANNGALHGQSAELHPSGATSFPYTSSRFGGQPYSRAKPLGVNHGAQGYLNIDTQRASNRTPSDGRSPIGDGSFPPNTPADLDRLSAAFATVSLVKGSQPGNGSLGSIRSRDPSPARNDGHRDYSPVALHLNGSQFHDDPHAQQQQSHGRNASDPNQGVSLDELPRSSRLVLLEFKLNRKEVFFCDASMDVKQGDRLIVEGDRGKDIGIVINPDVEKHWLRQGGMADLGSSSSGHAKAKRAYAIAGPQEAHDLAKKEEDEQKALQLCQSKVRQKKLPMQVVDCEFQWDRRKLTFYFIAESRIDFRDLVRELFRLYKTRIWMSCVSGPLAGPTSNIVY